MCWDDVEELVEKLKEIEEGDLINLDATVDNLVSLNDDQVSAFLGLDDRDDKPLTSVLNDKDEEIDLKRLPLRAIVYDYTTQPVIVREIKRKFLPNFCTTNVPFLRPIVIDGVGLVKAYRNCCCTHSRHFPFPIVPIMRCIFYWISKGHSTVLCFPSMFNPINCSAFNATQIQKDALNVLRRFKLCTIFETITEEDNKEWYTTILKLHRACLITTVSQWHLSMPNNLESGVMMPSVDGLSGYRIPYNNQAEKCPERLLQPFFSHEGKMVFFSSFSAAGACVADMILESAVLSYKDFQCLDENQLSFTEQAKMLKVIYDYLPEMSRFRETSVMVKVLQRLKPFLP